LQTERDKMRVMEGLEGANQGGEFDRPAMERTLAGLGKRRFLLHNVHEDHPVVFATRWVLSYLAGPMTRSQISQLMDGRRPPADAPAPADARQSAGTTDTVVLAPAISQYFAPGGDSDTVYYPRLVGAAELYFSNARYGVEQERQVLCTLELDDDGAAPDWDAAERHDESADSLLSSGADGARFADCPAAAADAKAYPAWQRDFSKWLRQHETIVLYRSKRYRLTSTATETEGQFRARLQQADNEQRDLAIGKIRKRYATKTTTLENRLLRAEQSLEREQQQASKKHLDTVVSFGTAILGAVLGRKRVSASTTQKIGTAVKSASSSRKEAGDVERARRTAEQVRADITELEAHLADEIAALDVSGSAQDEELTEIVVKAKTSDVRLPVFGLLWVPYTDRGDGRLQAAWR
jgi:hypothetical protein